jgi:hypothetical protein
MAPAPSAAQPREWISPQGQLNRLFEYNVQSIAYPISTIISSEQLGRVKEIPEVAGIIFQYTLEALSPNLTNWYTSLQRIGALPDKVPALPWNMPQILDSKCPIRSDERKPDGTHYKLSDTHSLYLILPGSPNELETRVRAYGSQALNDQGGRLYPNNNPLQFRFFGGESRREYGDVRSREYQWVLISNDVLPKSRKKSYQKQAQKVAELSKKAFVNYEVPSLYAVVAVHFLHRVATGGIFQGEANAQNGNLYTYTRVKETIHNYHLIVGSFSLPLPGVSVSGYDFDLEQIGIVALRKF